ncbi:MAG: hypothetical protein M3Q08_15505 [Pseudomonadota bacterium]|nr:hypothetical protein [Pseudomonadota bacterium]
MVSMMPESWRLGTIGSFFFKVGVFAVLVFITLNLFMRVNRFHEFLLRIQRKYED